VTFPAATFAAVAPPPDGLVLAFSSARRRRNGKAAVAAFGGAVAIASVLSFLAPPGQSLVQEPAQPARSGLLTELPDAPRHGAPAPLVRDVTTVNRAPVAVPAGARSSRLVPAARLRARPTAAQPACNTARTLLCADLQPPIDGGPTMRARLCPAAATVTVEYTAPRDSPTRFAASRTVAVGSCPG
jgi:hypothetical protein